MTHRSGFLGCSSGLLRPELVDSLYAHTVLVVSPLGGGEHIGLIVNRPTELTLGKIFPEDAASQKVREPVYLGGPVRPELIFALVERATSPGGKSLPVMRCRVSPQASSMARFRGPVRRKLISKLPPNTPIPRPAPVRC